jgi:uncharacterized membrane protein YkoI
MEAARIRKWLIAGAISIGAALGAYGIAGAATTATTTTSSASSSTRTLHSNEAPAHEKSESAQREADENSGKFGIGRPGNETPVAGSTAEKIKAAALAAVPGTVTKTEQRADGTYEAEITKSDGSQVHVSLDKNFVVTSTNSGCQHGPGNAGTGASFGA